MNKFPFDVEIIVRRTKKGGWMALCSDPFYENYQIVKVGKTKEEALRNLVMYLLAKGIIHLSPEEVGEEKIVIGDGVLHTDCRPLFNYNYEVSKESVPRSVKGW